MTCDTVKHVSTDGKLFKKIKLKNSVVLEIAFDLLSIKILLGVFQTAF